MGLPKSGIAMLVSKLNTYRPRATSPVLGLHIWCFVRFEADFDASARVWPSMVVLAVMYSLLFMVVGEIAVIAARLLRVASRILRSPAP